MKNFSRFAIILLITFFISATISNACDNYEIIGKVTSFSSDKNYNYDAVVAENSFSEKKIKVVGNFKDPLIENGKIYFKINAKKTNDSTYTITKVLPSPTITERAKSGYIHFDCK